MGIVLITLSAYDRREAPIRVAMTTSEETGIGRYADATRLLPCPGVRAVAGPPRPVPPIALLQMGATDGGGRPAFRKANIGDFP